MIGIDFGTSTTEVALSGPGRTAALVPDPDGLEVVPSVVAFPPNGRTLVGKSADVRRLIDPKNTLVSVKRIVGLPFFAKEVAEYRDAHPYPLERGEDGLPRFTTRSGWMTPAEVVGKVFEWIRTWPRLQGGGEPVVVTAPASFEPTQRDALVRAAAGAGFEDVQLVDEPFAALLPYLREDGRERTVVVYDLGGGTFDVAVMRVKGHLHRLLACGGDPWLGGDDLDDALARWAASEILESFHWDVRTSADARHQLLFMLSRAKVRLSLVPSARLDLSLVDPVLSGRELILGRERLAGAVHVLIQRTFAICDEALGEAGLRADAVDEVILAGGSSYMPAIREAVRQYFGREPRCDLPPDHLVALGASLYGSLAGEGRRERGGAHILVG